MTLASIISYVFALEGQWIATQSLQLTSAGLRAEGVALDLENRFRRVAAIAEHPMLLEAILESDTASRDAARTWLSKRHLENEQDSSLFCLYNAAEERLLTSNDVELEDWEPDFPGPTDPEDISFYHFESDDVYTFSIIVEVVHPDTGERIGYLEEFQSIHDLIRFALGKLENEAHHAPDRNGYAVFYVDGPQSYAVMMQQSEESDSFDLVLDQIDPRLLNRISETPSLLSDAFITWFVLKGKPSPTLLAYQRFNESSNFVFVVHRPLADIVATINLGAFTTIIVSGLVIIVFCVVGYRIVNNNIIRPVSLLNEGAQIVRRGDLDLKLKIDTGDEIEELASSFNKMASALRSNITQLEDSEEKFRNLIEFMREGLYQTDRKGILRFVNPVGAVILGYENADALLGHAIQRLFMEEMDFERIVRVLEKQNFIEQNRVWMLKRDGRSICVELSANKVFDDEGELMGVEGTFRDVTQSVHLERDAAERSDRISAINQITNVINSSIEAGKVYDSIVKEIRNLIHFDYAALTLVDEEARCVIQQLFPVSTVEPPTANEVERSPWLAEQAECQLLLKSHHAEIESMIGAPSVPLHSYIVAPLFAGGKIIGDLILGSQETNAYSKRNVEAVEQLTPHVAVAIQNAKLLENLQQSLEEVTLAREKLHEANEELKSLDEMKTNLLSNVSHELRTPLVAVMGYTDMILNGKVGPVNEMQVEYLNISLRNIEKLVTLIENLLDFSKLHRGAEEMVFDTFDLVDCAKMALQIIRPIANGRDIKLVLNAPDEPVWVEGDKGKLGQVFNNLLSNAVKFNDPEGVVTIDIRLADDSVHVSVADTGIGIPEEALDKVFTRFYQYDGSSTRKYGGTGIGLAIAQDIMRLHGSRLTASSTEGEGALFQFTLAQSGVRKNDEEISTPRTLIPTETHLLVELVSQDRALSNQVRNLLLSEGIDVIHAAYPAGAMSLANKYSPDLLLIDVEEEPAGEAFLEEMLSQPAMIDVPIVLLSNDDALCHRLEDRIAGRVRRGFRKSMLLSGIHYALSHGLETEAPLGDKILCVDDDPEILQFITRCLRAEGYSVDSCSNGEDALHRVITREYWLVLLDIAMPGMDGWETCRQMKSDAGLSGLKVYMVTAKSIQEDGVARIRHSGAEGYLLKPFRAEELLGLVQGFESHRPENNHDADRASQDEA